MQIWIITQQMRKLARSMLVGDILIHSVLGYGLQNDFVLLSNEIYFSILLEELVNRVVTQYTLQSLRPFVWVQPYQPARGWWVLSARSDRGWPADEGIVREGGGVPRCSGTPTPARRLVYPALARALSCNPFSRVSYPSRTRIYIARLSQTEAWPSSLYTEVGRSERGVPLDPRLGSRIPVQRRYRCNDPSSLYLLR